MIRMISGSASAVFAAGKSFFEMTMMAWEVARLVSPEVLESRRGELCVADRVLDVLVTQVVLDCPCTRARRWQACNLWRDGACADEWGTPGPHGNRHGPLPSARQNHSTDCHVH